MKAANKTFLNISSFQVLVMLRRGLFYSYLAIYLRAFLGLSVTETTLFATLSMIVNVLFQSFVWGRLSDKLQLRRTLIIVGEILAAIITFLVWWVHTMPTDHHTAGYVIIIGMTVIEIFWSMSNVGWSALLSDIYPEHERAGLQGRIHSVGAIGRFVGVWVGGLLYDGLSQYYDGWGFDQGALFFIASGAMLLSSIPMFFVPEGGVAAADEPTSSESNGRQELKGGLRGMSRKYLVFLLAMVFFNFGLNSVVLLKPQYLTLDEGFGISSQTLSYILNVTSVAGFAVGLTVKRLSNRFWDEHLLLVATAMAVVHLILLVIAKDILIIYISEGIGGAARILGWATSYAYASRLIPPRLRGRQFAWFNATMFLSWGLPATLITGPIADYLIGTGATQVFSYQMAFLAAAVMALAGTVTLICVVRMSKDERSSGVRFSVAE